MEKGEGIDLCKRYNVMNYPTFLFLDPDGYVEYMGVGFKPADEFLALGKKALDSRGKGEEGRFGRGERQETFIKAYLRKLLDYHQAGHVEKVLNTLYAEQGFKVLKDADYWHAYEVCGSDFDLPLALDVVKKRKQLYKWYGRTAVDQKIRNLYVCFVRVFDLFKPNMRRHVLDEEKRQAYMTLLQERNLPDYEGLQAEVDFILLLRTGQVAEAFALGEKELADAGGLKLCNWAAVGERLCGDVAHRSKMAVWAERALTMLETEEATEECKSVLRDLKEETSPQFRHQRKSIPMLGYE